MSYAPFICAVISFLVVWYVTPWSIRFLRKIELVDVDQNKENKPKIPISSGLAVIIGLFAGLMSYIFFRTFLPGFTYVLNIDDNALTLLFAAVTSILLITFVGFIDDLLRKKSHYDFPGLRQWQKPLLTLIAAVPFMVVNAGATEMSLPFIGVVNLGLLYPLIVIPIGVVGAANMVNMIGGFNGLEAGMGIVYTGMLGIYAYVNGSYLASLIALMAFASLIAFYFYNKYPAKILPGDSLTYLLGAVIVSIAILGNIEKAALIISIPFFIEFVLKARSRFKAQTYGYYKDGKICSKYSKIYSLPHIFTRKGRFTEKQIVYFMILIELAFSSLIWVIR